mmetsp:Transcript_14917/g.32525  ORF Transcript_14917/g.32525 Transcript_14917/m.32525 type:complete len:121 (+) Transcript_14917:569-931(+)|eukprot:CAMPEP_0172537768 /NCGR_PEP_ID=MMETSP1067-20121228/9307_1 /TAXON_ID=265564 ORGANISM="Thalassiosira punctigera, Strain Tpunct2005C2" /NCGR_SAMPLE_ID=MMETSP1067 /ASSEMBLY_ACC=CAM_ASM_000444 /LENGTH=120 /DNA_ID=CAMNT_0013323135 /DNA_START=560 /DNA_END=922 /DNA_ORIENTATION=-
MGKKLKRRQPADAATTPPADTPTAGVRLKIGDRVTLENLKSQAYNGRVGKVVYLPKLSEDDGRYGILLDGKGEPIGIRKVNIRISEEAKGWKSTEQQLEERQKNLEASVESQENMSTDQL